MMILNLCAACVSLYMDCYTVKKTKGGVDNKITCDHCKRRRYGATYEISPKLPGKEKVSKT